MDMQLKILLVGDESCGKTQLMYTKCHCSLPIVPTIGVDLMLTNIECPRAKLIIWDTSGQTSYREIVSSYYRGATKGVIISFDLTNETSFINMKEIWIPMFQQYSRKNCVALVVGMKNDLEKERIVSRERVLTLLDDLNKQLRYFEVSGKTGHNVELVFTELTKDIIEKIETEETNLETK